MKNKFNTATFLRQLALTLLVAMLAAAFQTARAQDSYPEYITEVIVVGGSKDETNTAKKTYEEKGYTFCEKDLNAGCGSSSDYIYLGYKTESRANTNGGYITDFVVIKGSNPPATISYNGRTYSLCPYDGGDHFKEIKGNLNSNVSSGWDFYLYYTKDNYDKRAVNSITFNNIKSGAVDLTENGSGGIDLNAGCGEDTDYIYMHITTTPKSNRPSNDPVMASGLTYNGDPQALLTIDNTNTGTMMYSVNDGGFSSTIPTATDAGNYTVKYYAASNNYGDQSETKSQTVSIAKANNNKVTTTAALNLTYNGSAQNLINAYSATFGTIQYSLDGTNYSATVLQGKDAKTYTIYYKVAETSNYNGVSGTATATIKKAANNNATVSIANSIDGRANVNPTVNNNLSTGTITYQYSKSSNSGFSTAKPNAPGTWYVKATIAADGNCDAYTTATQNFTLIDWEGDGTSSSPYLIKTTTDLDRLAQRVNAGNQYTNYHFRVENNITYGNTKANNFTAIGTDEHPFNGTFDGGNNNGYTISGIRINASSNYQGLFGYVESGAKIQNVTLEDAEITCSGDAVGGIAGRNHGSISNCTSSATVSSSGNEWWYYGGIVGKNYGSISNCTSSATVSASGKECFGYGGIVGYNYGTLTNNLAIDAVISTSSDTYGAIAGHNTQTLQNNFYYNTTVNGVTTNVGCDGADIEDNKGAVSLHTITLGEDISITSPASPTKTYDGIDYYAQGTGITLAYSSTVPEGALLYYTINDGEPTTSNKFTMPAQNTTVAAAVEQYYTITLGEGISITSPASPALTSNGIDYYAQGTVLTLSYASGKHFLANGNLISGTSYTMPKEDVTFTPCYFVNYTLDGGTLPSGIDNPTIYTSGTLTLPTPTRDYYTFDGWYQGNTKITSISGITADITLTAKWTLTEYKITYNLNDGTLPDGTANPTTYTVESSTITLPTPTRNYYDFDGWYDSDNFEEGNVITTIDPADTHADVELYAKWTPMTITEIHTTDDLIAFSNTVNAGNNYSGIIVTLNDHIDFNPTDETTNNFTAIGTEDHPFYGTFDGQGHTISGIRINTESTRQGLFGMNEGVIKNLTIDNAVIVSKWERVGSIAGVNEGTISNCVVTNNVKLTSDQLCGGVVGENTYYGTISNCVVTNNVELTAKSAYSYCGGVVGFNNTRASLSNNLVIGATIIANDSYQYYGAIAGNNRGTLQNNFYYNTTVNDVTTKVGCKGADIEDQNGAVPPDFIIDGDSETPVAITESNAGANVLYLRKLKKGVTSTITLPFDFNASSMDGIFYQLTSVNTDDWTAGANIVTGTLSANTPYLFLPNADIEQVMFPEVTLTPTTGSNSVKIDDHWTFHGVYEKILWETAPDNHYGFSAINKGDNIAAGDFVKIGQYVRIKPTRAYLTYNDGISKSAIVLPDRIQVVFSDEEIASVIDPIDTPTDDTQTDDDITTPVSEQPAQASNVKVWSYEKTIYIQAAPMTDYCIIDATGRVLRSATTQTDRDEIRLGHHDGIVIVIINHKTYKINY